MSDELKKALTAIVSREPTKFVYDAAPQSADPQPDKGEIMRLADEYAYGFNLVPNAARATLSAAVERVCRERDAHAKASAGNYEAFVSAASARDRAEREAAENKRDAKRLDWIERFIAENGEIHLHDGKHPRGTGLGLIGRRTLRAAIDAAMEEK